MSHEAEKLPPLPEVPAVYDLGTVADNLTLNEQVRHESVMTVLAFVGHLLFALFLLLSLSTWSHTIHIPLEVFQSIVAVLDVTVVAHFIIMWVVLRQSVQNYGRSRL